MKAQEMKTQQICRDFLRMRRGSVVEAIMVSQMIREHWGLVIDWHEVSEALEYLVNSREAERVGWTGKRLTKYHIV